MLKLKYAFLFCFSLLLVNSFGQSGDSNYCDSILSKAILTAHDFERLDSVLFSMNYYASSAPLKLYHRARNKAKAAQLNQYVIRFETMIADLFYELSNQDSSFYYANHAAKFAKDVGDELGYAKTANIRRLIHTTDSDFTEAYEVCFEALYIFEKYEDNEGVAITNRDIGSIKMQEGKTEEALSYCSKAIPALEEAQDWYELTFSYQRMAIANRNLGNFDTAQDYIQKAMDACRKLKGFRVQQGLSKKYFTRGYIYDAAKQYEQALIYYDSAKFFAQNIGFDLVDRSLFNFKGGIYLKQGDYQKALSEFEKSIALTNAFGLDQKAFDYYNPVYQNIVNAYKGLGNYKKANEYIEKISSAKDSIFKLESEQLVAELQTKYETVQKELTIATLRQDKRTQERFLFLASFLLSSFILVAFLLWRSNRYRARINNQLKDQKREIELKNDQNKLLLKEIHHRVKNNLQIISSLLNIQAESIEDVAAYDAIQESKNRVASMSLIHQKLYMGENLSTIEMRNYFETMGGAILEGFGSKAEHICLEVDMPEMELDIDSAIPVGLITNELITNSVKYAFPEKRKGHIRISLERLDNQEFKLVIADDGTPTSGKASSEGTGFGSLLVQLLTAQLGGKLDITTKGGTAAVIQFPPQVKSAV